MRVFATLLLALLWAAPAFAQSDGAASPRTLSVHRLENVRILTPSDDDPKAMVVYFSDRSGWSAEDDRITAALTAQENIVLAVDLATYATNLDKDDGACLYVVGEITDLAQTAQRQLNIQTYLPPIVAGRGEGATFAYAALADAPDNTLGGAVASGFSDRLTLKLPFCPGSTATKTADGTAYSYAFDDALPEPATLFVEAAKLDAVTAAAAVRENITVAALEPNDAGAQIAAAVAALAEQIEPFGQLPAVDLPATTTPKALAVLVSGDGGWRDLDKTIGEWLSTQGVHVVGLDALHYFWAKRTPEELATDVAALIREANPAGDLPVMLIGYSFGADTLPFSYPLLPKELQARTKVLALMAPSQTTSFQVTVAGWLGIDDSGYAIVPAIAALPTDRVICVYGKDEDDTACIDPKLAKVEKVETDGGHHFDGNYTAIAQRFLDRLG